MKIILSLMAGLFIGAGSIGLIDNMLFDEQDKVIKDLISTRNDLAFILSIESYCLDMQAESYQIRQAQIEVRNFNPVEDGSIPFLLSTK